MTSQVPLQKTNPLLVSIVTIVFNGKETLERTIQSVREQTYPHIEYIVIDGGSTDGTVDLIQQNTDTIAYWKSEPDKGISDAFNKGLAACNGDLIGIINADDWYEPDAVEAVVKRAAEGEVFYGNLRYWKGTQPSFQFRADHRQLNREMTLNHPTVFVKKDLYQQFGNFSLDFKCAMDYELLLRFYQGKSRFIYLDRVLANMAQEGISDVQWMKGCQEVRKAKKMHFEASISHDLWFWKQVWAIRISRFLEKSGGSAVLKFYRNRFSAIRKTKD